MDPEIKELKELMRQNIKLSQETNDMIRSMRRSTRISSFFHLLYWIAILTALGFSYFFISPYIMQLKNAYEKLQSSAGEAQTLEQQVSTFFKNLNPSQQ